jgi:hypothetical protein
VCVFYPSPYIYNLPCVKKLDGWHTHTHTHTHTQTRAYACVMLISLSICWNSFVIECSLDLQVLKSVKQNLTTSVSLIVVFIQHEHNVLIWSIPLCCIKYMNQFPSVNTTIFLYNKIIIHCPGYMFRLNNEPSSGLQIQAKIYKMRLILGSHYYYKFLNSIVVLWYDVGQHRITKQQYYFLICNNNGIPILSAFYIF